MNKLALFRLLYVCSVNSVNGNAVTRRVKGFTLAVSEAYKLYKYYKIANKGKK